VAGKTRRATFQDPGGDLFAKYAGIKARAERAIRFIEAECMVPEGRGTGKPYRLRPYQKRAIRRLLGPGVLVGILSAPRGWTKSGLAAAIAVWALYDREAAQVLITSTSLRTARIPYGRAVRIIELNPELAKHAQVYRNAAEPWVELPVRGSKMLPLPAEEKYIVGGSPTLIIVDELGYVTADTYEAMQTSLGKTDDGLLFGMGTPGLGVVGTDSEPNQMWAMRQRALSDSPAKGVVWVEYAAGQDDDPSKRATWRKANPALGDLVGYREVELDYETMPPSRFAQMRLGRWTQSETAWMPIDTWERLDVVGPAGACADGTLVALGFDGSATTDTTALVAYEMTTGRLVVLGHWQRPANARDWAVPRDEVIAAIDVAFTRLAVVMFYGDPWYWRSELQELALRYGDRVQELNTASAVRMGPATDALMTAVRKRDVAWDGTEALRVHILAAVAKRTQAGDVIVKDARHPQPIDIAVAAILAHEAGRSTPLPDHGVY
jgi:phage terminase large subunit-like protein